MKTIYERIIPLAEAEKDRVAKELSLHKKQYEIEVEKLYHLLVRYESFLKAQDEIGIVELTSSQYRERARDVVKQEIERQQLYVTQSKNRYERAQEALERALIEEKKFSRLQENHTVETKRIEALTEQNQLDELALLQFGRGRMI
ncbi:flagellar protein FliJ [Exiguobacterium indicum]|uniref:Flagellar FliJ protein n=1 Tax=Exiguobacterium acetylicum TaxID=41170 RepID=A0ABX8G6G4_EXIAC|nr:MULTISPECIES: flagellar FliJ family protein [Exiguobacterium]AOT01077.1 flagellar protein FliJ [Exiguobacterium sp. U13-1]KNH36352.1 flagellar protein FliJ [Exiguobacterium acetylicum]KTR59463.1 flagellar protein FliJ [Exiguobacterium indicum]MBF8152552.1 flagellar FliJ family protein [Exiguobacterium sp. TBG-PICH-001]OAI89431.1 flagellar protein FliJ [Exiguobacterium sp. KKBO11]